jgi:hypothetical protein
VDNINIDANTISAVDSNGSIILAPKGTGVVQITKTLNANSQNITNAGTITATTLTGTLSTAAQPNITSIGSLTTLNATTVNATNLAGTLTTAAQPNITAVGTLTGLNVSNLKLLTNTISTTNVNGNLILAPDGTGVVQLSKALNANSQNITNVATITATSVAGTLTTAAQPNITSLGTISTLTTNTITSTNQLVLQSSNAAGVKIDNFRTPWCQITTPAVTYFTQNINITGMSMNAASSYSLYTLTSGTTLTVSESMDVLMIMNASLSDEANERAANIELYENGVFITSASAAIPYLDTGISFASVSLSRNLFLTSGRSYTWRFSSVAQGTADLRSLIVYITRI